MSHATLRTWAVSHCSTLTIPWAGKIWVCRKRLQPFLLVPTQITADLPFISAHWPSTSGFPGCLWLSLVKKNCGGFCLLLESFVLPYIWNSDFMCTKAFSSKAEILNLGGCWARQTKSCSEGANYENYWGNLIAEDKGSLPACSWFLCDYTELHFS